MQTNRQYAYENRRGGSVSLKCSTILVIGSLDRFLQRIFHTICFSVKGAAGIQNYIRMYHGSRDIF